MVTPATTGGRRLPRPKTSPWSSVGGCPLNETRGIDDFTITLASGCLGMHSHRLRLCAPDDAVGNAVRPSGPADASAGAAWAASPARVMGKLRGRSAPGAITRIGYSGE
ncbi:hypothetical protein KRMM14A1259_57870 [Krasilnikovia sp. MM14-A1259]